jgi:hypothetical protein
MISKKAILLAACDIATIDILEKLRTATGRQVVLGGTCENLFRKGLGGNSSAFGLEGKRTPLDALGVDDLGDPLVRTATLALAYILPDVALALAAKDRTTS